MGFGQVVCLDSWLNLWWAFHFCQPLSFHSAHTHTHTEEQSHTLRTLSVAPTIRLYLLIAHNLYNSQITIIITANITHTQKHTRVEVKAFGARAQLREVSKRNPQNATDSTNDCRATDKPSCRCRFGHRQSTKTSTANSAANVDCNFAAIAQPPPSLLLSLSALAFRRLAPFRILVHLPAFCSDSFAAFLRKYATPPSPSPSQLTTTHKSCMLWRMQRRCCYCCCSAD